MKYGIKSFGQTFNLILEDSGDGLEVSHPAVSRSLALLGLRSPPV